MQKQRKRRSDSVTIREVATQARVSVATVSRFINQNAPVSVETAERIQQVMLDMNYQPYAAARHLVTRRTQTIGLVLYSLQTDFFLPLLSAIEAAVSENQYNLLVAGYKSPVRKDSQPPIGAHNTDGLLVFADSLSDEHLMQLSRSGFPLVLLYRTSPPNLKIPFVTVENRIATRKIIDHLIEEHGRRSIILLRGPQGQEDSQAREQGYCDSLEEHGIAIEKSLFMDGDFNSEVAYLSIKELVSGTHHHFDAIFTGDDDAAIGVLTALNEVGLRVPEDVAVVGFDDSRLSTFLNPPLTTVRAPTEEVGRTAMRLLFAQIHEQPAESVTLQPTGIILRRSCGCPYEAPGRLQ
jgi:LacI family transcriptional regulator, galactose operon repressor